MNNGCSYIPRGPHDCIPPSARDISQQRTITLRILGNGRVPIIRPDDFLRTRMKSGSRFFLVIDAETIPPARAGLYPKVRCLCFVATREDWLKRELPGQLTHWYQHTRRKPDPLPCNVCGTPTSDRFRRLALCKTCPRPEPNPYLLRPNGQRTHQD